jgi:hypothetical protein
MSRGLTEPFPTPEEKNPDQDTVEINQAIDELYVSHNMLHDRLIRLERESDHCACKTCKCKDKTLSQEEASAEVEAADRKFWKRGL